MGRIDFRTGNLTGKFGGMVGFKSLSGTFIRSAPSKVPEPSASQLLVRAGVDALVPFAKQLADSELLQDFYTQKNACSMLAKLMVENIGNVPNCTSDVSSIVFSRGSRAPFSSLSSWSYSYPGRISATFVRSSWYLGKPLLPIMCLFFNRVTGEFLGLDDVVTSGNLAQLLYDWPPPAYMQFVAIGLDTDGLHLQQSSLQSTGYSAGLIAALTNWVDTCRAYGDSRNLYSLLTRDQALESAFVSAKINGYSNPMTWDEVGNGSFDVYGDFSEYPVKTGASAPYLYTQAIPSGLLKNVGVYSRLVGVGWVYYAGSYHYYPFEIDSVAHTVYFSSPYSVADGYAGVAVADRDERGYLWLFHRPEAYDV